MHAGASQYPPRRAFRPGYLDHRAVELLGVDLTATPVRRLEAAQEARLDQFLPGDVGEPAEFVRLRRTFPEHRRQSLRLIDQGSSFFHGSLPLTGGRSAWHTAGHPPP